MTTPQPAKQEAAPETPAQDLGFGVAIIGQRGSRLVNHDGSFNVRRTRVSPLDYLSYATLLQVRWPAFFGLVIAVVVGINFLFAAGYLLCGRQALALAGPPSHIDRVLQAFFFSVHTFSTIGYGNVVPVGLGANLLVVLEAIMGLLSTALVTGLVFARFSRPNIRIEFSHVGVMRLHGKPALLVRFRNLTRNELLEVEATLLAWFLDRDDHKTRHFHVLPVERNRITFLPLSWTVAHFITPESPFFGLSETEFRARCGEVVLQVRGSTRPPPRPSMHGFPTPRRRSGGARAMPMPTTMTRTAMRWGSMRPSSMLRNLSRPRAQGEVSGG